MPCALKRLFLVTDIGFIAYWLATVTQVIGPDDAFADHRDPILDAWNWSFLPLDLLISASGLLAVALAGRGRPAWRSTAIVSLVLTSCSGLMAIGFWAIQGSFDPAWWIPNLYLLLYPLLFLPGLMAAASPAAPRAVAGAS